MIRNGTLKRKRSLRDSYADKIRKSGKAQKPQFKKGPKAKQWDADRAKLKEAFRRAGITTCELQLNARCKGMFFLTFCHSKKRRFVITPQDREEVVLGCVSCHDLIEKMPHEGMRKVVLDAIADRETAVESIFD